MLFIYSCNSPAPIAAEDWCLTQPCYEWFGITINQISSSILVYILGFYGIYVGYIYYKNRQDQRSRLFWSYSLILGGIGALSAGTSFQAFGYEIKCAGKALCDLTSSFEIVNNVLMVWSAAFMMFAVSASFLNAAKLKPIGFSLLIYGTLYTVVCLWGFYDNIYVLVSFEFLLIYTGPTYLAIFILSILQGKHKIDLGRSKYITAWIILTITPIAYYIFLLFGFTEMLWSKGIWFSANDVLHLGMLGWLYYLSNYLLEAVVDKSQ